MGLAASQGRLLLLTARKTDLEFRAQQISQKRINLSQQLEDISSTYAEATSNRQMKISMALTTTGAAANSEQVYKSLNLTYAALMSGLRSSTFGGRLTGIKTYKEADEEEPPYAGTSAYRLVSTDGAIVVASKEEIYVGEDGAPYDKENIQEDGKFVTVTNPQGQTIKYIVDPVLAYGSTKSNSSTDEPNYLQDCLRNGKYLLERITVGETDATNNVTSIKANSIAWDSTTNISDSYYTEDDDKAEAIYSRQQTEIQNQDKKLELELDNIETQRSEVKTEKESVEKVLTDNIEDSCNVFA